MARALASPSVRAQSAENGGGAEPGLAQGRAEPAAFFDWWTDRENPRGGCNMSGIFMPLGHTRAAGHAA